MQPWPNRPTPARPHRSTPMRGWLCCVLACWMHPISLQAQEPSRFALHVVRSPEASDCITGAELASHVERHLGPVFVAPGSSATAIEIWIGPSTSSGHPWRAQIELYDRQGARLGTRRLLATDNGCRSLDRALVLAVALAVDPDGLLIYVARSSREIGALVVE
jgi:hypothetical protein